jgi:DNA repair ATPase RecN
MFNGIAKVREKCAKFYKADFHVHSPLSGCWKNEDRDGYKKDPNLDRIVANKITDNCLKAFCEKCLSSGLHIVAITDHMKYSFALKCVEYAKKNYPELMILPGIELNIKIDQTIIKDSRIHVLAIFPPDIGTSIDRIFPLSFPEESKRNGQEDLACNDIKEIVEKIKEVGGIAIAAHIYGENGVRYIYTKATDLLLERDEANLPPEKGDFYKKICDGLKEELFKFSCLQVKKTTEPIHFHDKDGELRIPLVISSDAHHPTTIGQLDKITFIKMGNLSYYSLKEALKFPDTRIRFKDNLPEAKPPRLLSVRVVGKKENENTFFNNSLVGFSDNLTCLIGPRGSGKSALIDAIRYLMGYNRTLDEVPKTKDQVIERQLHTLSESKIELLYEKSDGVVHRLEAIFDPREPYNTKVFDKDNNELNIGDVEKCGDYPLNLYGWNELELLAENPQSQRENLDKFIPELSGFKEEKSSLYTKLNESRRLCIEHLTKMDRYFDTKRTPYSFLRLKEYENEYRKLNTPEIEKHFKDIDELNRKANLLSEIKAVANDSLVKIQDMLAIDISDILKSYIDLKEWAEELTEKKLEINILNASISKNKLALEGKIKGVMQVLDQELKELSDKKLAMAKNMQQAIGVETAITADLRNNAKKRYDATKQIYDFYIKDIAILNKYLEEREKILLLIKDVNRIIFATRNEQKEKIKTEIQLVQDPEFIIDLKLEQAGDKSDFENILMESKIGIKLPGQWKRKRLPEIIASSLTPPDFFSIVMNKQKDALVKLKIILLENDIPNTYGIEEKYADELLTGNIPFEDLVDLDTRKYDKEKLENLLLLQEVSFDDKFYIELGGKPIQFCSPGQRCSAMLPIVTLTSTAPIIIDQPEDNLDNRLVSKAVFKILSKLKETRQIIVATHNPNILVSGDAEQVVVLKSDGTIEDHGSIDEPTVVQKVINLMEGGKDAFQKREKKYSQFL